MPNIVWFAVQQSNYGSRRRNPPAITSPKAARPRLAGRILDDLVRSPGSDKYEPSCRRGASERGAKSARVTPNLAPATLAFLVGYVVFVAIRGAYDRGDRRAGASKRDLQEILVMACVGFGMMATPLVFIATPWLDSANFDAPLWAPVLGVAVMAGALILFWRSHADLGQNFSRTLEVQERHALITRGVYARMRHPMYAAIWLFAAAQALLLPNWIAGLAGLVGFAPMYFLRTPREEQMMIDAFGPEYTAYMKRTHRIFPRLS